MTDLFFKTGDEDKSWAYPLVTVEKGVSDSGYVVVPAQDRFHRGHKEQVFFMYPHHGGYIRVSPESEAWGSITVAAKDVFSQTVKAAFEQLQEPACRNYLLGGKIGEPVDWPAVFFVGDEPLAIDRIAEDRRIEFELHAEKWYEETKYVSSATEIILHPSYQRIIGMGPAVLPLIFRDLDRNGRDWFWALSSITGATPVGDADAGNVPMMKAAWLEWGRRHEYVW